MAENLPTFIEIEAGDYLACSMARGHSENKTFFITRKNNELRSDENLLRYLGYFNRGENYASYL